MRRLLGLILTLLPIAIVLASCAPAPQPAATPTAIPTALPTAVPTAPPASAIANPASENCVKQGGKLVIETRSDGGQFGVCYFEDNRQCEEWALFRGDCPVGGRKVTGYVTEAARYCAITGGEYHITGNSNTDQETGTCTFNNGRACDAADYYDGKCTPDTGRVAYADPFAYCAAIGTLDAPDERWTGDTLPDSLVEGMIRQNIVTADAPPEFQHNAVWRCMNGQVWACHFGANLPCQEKADLSKEPTAEMNDFCAANRTADVIPAVVTGRATVYEWKCSDGKPEVVKQVFTSDAQGYLAEFWYAMTP
jgi:putative hemolysin